MSSYFKSLISSHHFTGPWLSRPQTLSEKWENGNIGRLWFNEKYKFIHSFKYWLIFCFISGASFNRNCNCHIFHFLIYPSNDWRTRQKFWNCFPICIAIDLKNGFYIYFPLENSKWKLWILKHKSSQVLYKA